MSEMKQKLKYQVVYSNLLLIYVSYKIIFTNLVTKKQISIKE